MCSRYLFTLATLTSSRYLSATQLGLKSFYVCISFSMFSTGENFWKTEGDRKERKRTPPALPAHPVPPLRLSTFDPFGSLDRKAKTSPRLEARGTAPTPPPPPPRWCKPHPPEAELEVEPEAELESTRSSSSCSSSTVEIIRQQDAYDITSTNTTPEVPEFRKEGAAQN